ncbi:MAG: ABC transporter permease [Clostridia bacterium]|nr:ABC transporter permease [Clostridia bacterium]
MKRNIKLAYKSVVFHFKQYLCFYVALFAIQFLFGIIVMSTVNTNHMRKEEILDEYDYHVCLVGLNSGQAQYLQEKQYAVMTNEYQMVDVVRTEQRKVGNVTYTDMYLLYENPDGDSPQEIHSWFNDKALSHIRKATFSNPGFNVNFSPLYSLNDTMSDYIWVCVGLLSILLVIGVIILVLLYNIRINHFKFTYGIYMSYGADFRKLFETSFWEMFVIQALTLVPATVVATIADWLFFLSSGYSYFFSPYMMLIALPYTGLAAYIAVYIPIKRAAVKPPLELLLAEDNSNLVISPRLSFNMSNRRFPTSYNLFSAIRFRKYNIQIVCSSVIFAALFICSMFCTNLYAYTMASSEPEYRVSFNQHAEKVIETVVEEKDVTEEYKKAENKDKYYNKDNYKIVDKDGNPGVLQDLVNGGKIFQLITKEVEKTIMVGDTYTAEKGQQLMAISGVTGVYKECSVSANETGTFVTMKPSRVKNDTDMVLFNGNAYTQDVTYYASDKEIVDYLVNNYKVKGDPYKLSENDDPYTHYVIVTNSRNNENMLSLKPGDVLIFDTIGELTASTDEPLTGKHLLQFVIENGVIDLEKSFRFEVCAVVENISTGSDYPMFISTADYKRVTGNAHEFKNVSVFVDQSYGEEEVALLTANIRSWAENFGDTTVTPLNALELKRAQLAECRLPLLVCVSATLLLLSPLFWFFSQTMFYKKRQKEMELLRAMGAIESEMRGLFIRDGLIYASFGALFTALLGVAGVYAIYRGALFILASVSNTFTQRLVFEVPWLAFIFGILVTVVCGFLSSMLPYYTDRALAKKRLTEFHSDDE